MEHPRIGVILSTIVRGMARVLGEHEAVDGEILAGAIRSGATSAYQAVKVPVEGTMLTVIREMAEEENSHRRQLIDLYREKFGEHIPLVRRHDVKGFLHHEPLWMLRPLGLAKVRRQAEAESLVRLFS